MTGWDWLVLLALAGSFAGFVGSAIYARHLNKLLDQYIINNTRLSMRVKSLEDSMEYLAETGGSCENVDE